MLFKKKPIKVKPEPEEPTKDEKGNIDLVVRYQQNRGYFEADVIHLLVEITEELTELNELIKKELQ